MGKRSFFVLIALAVCWIIFVEELTWQSLAMGLLVTSMSQHFVSRFLPYEELKNINFLRLYLYPLFLMREVYLSFIYTVKAVIVGPVEDIVYAKTKLNIEALKIILAKSITLTPGSITLDLGEDELVVLWLRNKHTPADLATIHDMLISSMEGQLKKAEQVEAGENLG